MKVIDGHNDLLWTLRQSTGYATDISRRLAHTRTDIPRLRAGDVGAQFWSVFVPSTLSGGDAVTATVEQIDAVHGMVARYPHELALCVTAAEVRSCWDSDRIACLIGVEGGHSMDNSLGVLRSLWRLGARYMTLTHNSNTPWADSATDEPEAGGLTNFGDQVIAEMNRLGMLVDLSHVSADTMRAAIDSSRAPVIFSHSSARALCDVPRNVPESVLRLLASNGGVCMVTFVPAFVSQDRADWEADPVGPAPDVTVAQVADHIDHVRDVAGIDHVGIGSDFDGNPTMPTGLDDTSCFPALVEELGRRGYSSSDLSKVAHGNILRVLDEAEQVAGE